MKEKVLVYYHQIADQYESESLAFATMVNHISNEFETDPQTVKNWIDEELHLIRTKKKFVSRTCIENSIPWLCDKRDWEAKKHGLCVHCHGTGRLRAKDPMIFPGNMDWKACDYCRATGRNLDLEARSYEVHHERVSKLSFSQCIREYVQLTKKRYSIDGYQPFTTDEDRWLHELKWRMSHDFHLGSQGNIQHGNFLFLPYIETVLFNWERRLGRVDKKLLKYVWEK